MKLLDCESTYKGRIDGIVSVGNSYNNILFLSLLFFTHSLYQETSLLFKFIAPILLTISSLSYRKELCFLIRYKAKYRKLYKHVLLYGILLGVLSSYYYNYVKSDPVLVLIPIIFSVTFIFISHKYGKELLKQWEKYGELYSDYATKT